MVLGGASLILANGTFGLMKWWCSVKVGDLVSKKHQWGRDGVRESKILYGVIVGIEASEMYVRIHWFGDYGAFWTNICDMEVIT
tara:strand:+ start:863 stop:1114 length:252 start_codon:yes stop_codon:yes gene_type:complete